MYLRGINALLSSSTSLASTILAKRFKALSCICWDVNLNPSITPSYLPPSLRSSTSSDIVIRECSSSSRPSLSIGSVRSGAGKPLDVPDSLAAMSKAFLATFAAGTNCRGRELSSPINDWTLGLY